MPRLKHGWFVPYRHTPNHPDQVQAVIRLFVQDLDSTFSAHMDFLIDTGSDMTIIPRVALKNYPDAFSVSRSVRERSVGGLIGHWAVGHQFRAALSVSARTVALAPISFGELRPLVVEDWNGELPVLGLDALRRVVLVSDEDHVCLWPKPHPMSGVL